MGGLVEGQGEFTWIEDTGLLTDAVTQSLRFKGLTTANIFSTVLIIVIVTLRREVEIYDPWNCEGTSHRPRSSGPHPTQSLLNHSPMGVCPRPSIYFTLYGGRERRRWDDGNGKVNLVWCWQCWLGGGMACVAWADPTLPSIHPILLWLKLTLTDCRG